MSRRRRARIGHLAGFSKSAATTLRPAAAGDDSVERPFQPLLRGVMHQWATLLALSLTVVLVVLASSARPRIGAIVYGVGLVACLGVSAVYHRGRWSRRVKDALCRLDHSTIFLLIAGTSTPIVLLTLHGAFGASLLLVEWVGALCGIGIAVLWRRPPIWAEVGPYLLLGWLGLLAVPGLALHFGPLGVILLAGGGALYSIGALLYAMERPNPWPSTFGFHEVFHVFVTLAAATHAVLISLLVLSA
jgi:hemolysin III